MDASAASAWTGNAIALIGIGYTWQANRLTKRQAAAARTRADESVRAAEEAAAAQQHMAEVMEKMYEADEHRRLSPTGTTEEAPHAARPRAADTSPLVRWSVQNVDAHAYVLTNAGGATAFDVSVTASHVVSFRPPERPAGQAWEAGESLEFSAVGSWHTGVPTIAVEWRDTADGPPRRWERVVPR